MIAFFHGRKIPTYTVLMVLEARHARTQSGSIVGFQLPSQASLCVSRVELRRFSLSQTLLIDKFTYVVMVMCMLYVATIHCITSIRKHKQKVKGLGSYIPGW